MKFPRAHRVRKRRDFLSIQSSGARVSTRSFVILVLLQGVGEPAIAGASPPHARLGIVVTKKIGNAVVRNRIKRICREAFRRSEGLFPGGTDVVVIARDGARALLSTEVMREWEGARSAIARASRPRRAPTDATSAPDATAKNPANGLAK